MSGHRGGDHQLATESECVGLDDRHQDLTRCSHSVHRQAYQPGPPLSRGHLRDGGRVGVSSPARTLP